ncbi:hypothetical protein H4582DRAFT_1925010 [Lactarius indigo]|nr:hypothetical protein H4582DRAFT_1925010 [Lactarius indigo]
MVGSPSSSGESRPTGEVGRISDLSACSSITSRTLGVRQFGKVRLRYEVGSALQNAPWHRTSALRFATSKRIVDRSFPGEPRPKWLGLFTVKTPGEPGSVSADVPGIKLASSSPIKSIRVRSHTQSLRVQVCRVSCSYIDPSNVQKTVQQRD